MARGGDKFNNRGFSNIAFLAVFFVLLVLVLEVFTIYQQYSFCLTEGEVIVTTALNRAIMKVSREGETRVSQSCLIEEITHLAGERTSQREGLGELKLERIETTDNSVLCQGKIIIRPAFVGRIFPGDWKVILPFRISAALQTID